MSERERMYKGTWARLTDEERDLLEKLAKAEGRNKSNMIRRAIYEAAERRGLLAPVAQGGEER
jgi:predicted DNA-binding protein